MCVCVCVVTDQSAKNAKIMRLKKLALYGSSFDVCVFGAGVNNVIM